MDIYYDYDENKEVNFNVLVGKTLSLIENKGEEIIFITTTGETYRQVYYNDCCASCSVEEVHGDLEDLLGSPILLAEQVSSRDPDKEEQEKRQKEAVENERYSDPESETWTFYKASTIKGSVTIRWYGSSNGYYSERPTFELLGDKK